MDSYVFPEPHRVDLREQKKEFSVVRAEYCRETGFMHPLTAHVATLVAAIVHLTWRGRKERPGWPERADLSQEALEAELQYVAERCDGEE